MSSPDDLVTKLNPSLVGVPFNPWSIILAEFTPKSVSETNKHLLGKGVLKRIKAPEIPLASELLIINLSNFISSSLVLHRFAILKIKNMQHYYQNCHFHLNA